MTFLPIVARELRVISRKAGTYWGRTVTATLSLGVAVWIYLITLGEPPASQAFGLFATLSGALMFVGGFSGMGITADVLSAEKREGTLGLLFLTPLRGYDVVLGKLGAGSLAALYGLLAASPLLALPLLMGGLSAGELARMVLLLLNTMLLSLAAGMAVSSISRDEKRARAGTLLILLGLAAGFPLIGAILENELHWHGVFEWFAVFSPGYAYTGAWDSTRRMPSVEFWTSMITLHASTWVLLGIACYFTPRTWQDKAVRQTSGWRRLLFDAGDARGNPLSERFRHRTLNRNAYLWLTTRPVHRPVFVWGVLGAVAAVWLAFGIRYPRDMFSLPMYVVIALTWNSILKVWVASEATRQISEDRRSGSIELLLSTPLSVSDIIRGQWLSLLRVFAWPVMVVVGVECLFVLIGMNEIGDDPEGWLMWGTVWGCGILMLFADLVALFLVGLWQAASAKSPATAVRGTAIRVLMVPWILFLVLIALWVVSLEFRLVRGLRAPGWFFWVGTWTAIGLVVNALFAMLSWRAVRLRFRQVAAQRSLGAGWGSRLARLFGRQNSGVRGK